MKKQQTLKQRYYSYLLKEGRNDVVGLKGIVNVVNTASSILRKATTVSGAVAIASGAALYYSIKNKEQLQNKGKEIINKTQEITTKSGIFTTIIGLFTKIFTTLKNLIMNTIIKKESTQLNENIGYSTLLEDSIDTSSNKSRIVNTLKLFIKIPLLIVAFIAGMLLLVIPILSIVSEKLGTFLANKVLFTFVNKIKEWAENTKNNKIIDETEKISKALIIIKNKIEKVNETYKEKYTTFIKESNKDEKEISIILKVWFSIKAFVLTMYDLLKGLWHDNAIKDLIAFPLVTLAIILNQPRLLSFLKQIPQLPISIIERIRSFFNKAKQNETPNISTL